MGANCKLTPENMKTKVSTSGKGESNSRDGSPVEGLFPSFDVIDLVKRRVRKKVLEEFPKAQNTSGVKNQTLQNVETSDPHSTNDSKMKEAPNKVQSHKSKVSLGKAGQSNKSKNKTWRDGTAKEDFEHSPKKRKISKKSSDRRASSSSPTKATPKKADKDLKNPGKNFDAPFVEVEVFKHVISILSVQKRTVSTQVSPNKGVLKGSVTVSGDTVPNPHDDIIKCLRTIIGNYRPPRGKQ